MAVPTLKAGWLLRESSVLKRWKQNWCVLYGDGNLAYYKDVNLQEREGNYSIPHSCAGIKTALECEVSPPEDRNYGTLLKLVSKQGDSLVISAFDSDEALAWKLMIEQFIAQAAQPQPQQVVHLPPGSRVSHVTQTTSYPNGATTVYPNGTTTVYRNYPSTVCYPGRRRRHTRPVYYYPNHGPVHVQYDSYGRPYYVHPHTQVITVVRDDDPYYYRTGDLMLGAAAGALVGAALWSPFFFF